MEKERIYRYKLGRKVIYSSIIYILLFVGVSVLLAFVYEGGYISAWFISLILAVLSLMILSIPRRVVTDEEGIEIQCIAEDTTLAYEDIAHIRKVEKREMNACLPIFGALGFFGHYGRFLNLRTMEFVHIYASRWGKFHSVCGTTLVHSAFCGVESATMRLCRALSLLALDLVVILLET